MCNYVYGILLILLLMILRLNIGFQNHMLDLKLVLNLRLSY